MTISRISQANGLVKKNKFDAFIISRLSNIRYLCGYSGSNGLVVLAPPKAYFLTDFRYIVQAGKEVKGCQIIIAERELINELIKLPCLRRKARVGFESAHLVVRSLNRLKELLPKATFIPVENLAESLAIKKDSSEINKIKKATKIADTVFSAILPLIKPGVKERDIALEISYRMVKLGADGPSFETIVASGQRSSMPHGIASDRRFKKGDFITLDFGCFYAGYASDLTRTVVLGKANARQKKLYNIVLKAQLAAIGAARAGMLAKELDKVARDVIVREGYGDYFGHGLGHGLGLEVHSAPVVAPRSEETLEVGNVFTIEPGIYIPNWGGVRIEDDVLLTDGACRVLTRAPKELIEL